MQGLLKLLLRCGKVMSTQNSLTKVTQPILVLVKKCTPPTLTVGTVNPDNKVCGCIIQIQGGREELEATIYSTTICSLGHKYSFPSWLPIKYIHHLPKTFPKSHPIVASNIISRILWTTPDLELTFLGNLWMRNRNYLSYPLPTYSGGTKKGAGKHTTHSPFKREGSGTSLVASWLRLRAPNAGDPGSIPGPRSHMLAHSNKHFPKNKRGGWPNPGVW